MNTTDKAIILIEELEKSNHDLRTQLAAVTSERDALKAALERIADYEDDTLFPNEAAAVYYMFRAIARDALQQAR